MMAKLSHAEVAHQIRMGACPLHSNVADGAWFHGEGTRCPWPRLAEAARLAARKGRA